MGARTLLLNNLLVNGTCPVLSFICTVNYHSSWEASSRHRSEQVPLIWSGQTELHHRSRNINNSSGYEKIFACIFVLCFKRLESDATFLCGMSLQMRIWRIERRGETTQPNPSSPVSFVTPSCCLRFGFESFSVTGLLTRPIQHWSSGLPSQGLYLLSPRLVLPSQRLGLPSQRLVLPSQRLGLPSQRLGLPSQRLGLPGPLLI